MSKNGLAVDIAKLHRAIAFNTEERGYDYPFRTSQTPKDLAETLLMENPFQASKRRLKTRNQGVAAIIKSETDSYFFSAGGRIA